MLTFIQDDEEPVVFQVKGTRVGRFLEFTLHQEPIYRKLGTTAVSMPTFDRYDVSYNQFIENSGMKIHTVLPGETLIFKRADVIR